MKQAAGPAKIEEFPNPVGSSYARKNTLFLAPDGVYIRPFPSFSLLHERFSTSVLPFIGLAAAFAIYKRPGSFDDIPTGRFVLLLVFIAAVGILLGSPGPVVNYLHKRRFKAALSLGSVEKRVEQFIPREAINRLSIPQSLPPQAVDGPVRVSTEDRVIILEMPVSVIRDFGAFCKRYYGAEIPNLPGVEPRANTKSPSTN